MEALGVAIIILAAIALIFLALVYLDQFWDKYGGRIMGGLCLIAGIALTAGGIQENSVIPILIGIPFMLLGAVLFKIEKDE